jgi:single-strand DNA-binding protein
VEGQLQTRKWVDQSGQEKYATEVVLQGFDARLILLDGKGEREDRPVPQGGAEPTGAELEDAWMAS